MSATDGWLVYRVDQGKTQIIGVYKTEEKAQGDVDVLARAECHGWQIMRAPFIGWSVAENAEAMAREKIWCTHPRATGGGVINSDGSTSHEWTCPDCGKFEKSCTPPRAN